MSIPQLAVVLDYLSLLVAERPPDQPFLVKQLQQAILYKFPGFTFKAYGLPNLKSFLDAGEKAGYFRLMNTGDPDTMYLEVGKKRTQTASPAFSEKRVRAAYEELLSAERVDQVMQAVRGVDLGALDQYLLEQERTAPSYPVRGKCRRLRTFISSIHTLGEWGAQPTWEPSRIAPSMPLVTPVGEAPKIAATVWAILDGSADPDSIPSAALDSFFFGVISYLRERLASLRAFDWLAALDILNDEFRAAHQRHTAGRGRGQKSLDAAEIAQTAARLRQEARFVAREDLLPDWLAYSALKDSDGCFLFLKERPRLVLDDQLLEWLDDQIYAQAEKGAEDEAVRLTRHAALLVGVKRYGVDRAKKHEDDLERLSDGLESGTRRLMHVTEYVRAPNGLRYFEFDRTLLRVEGVDTILHNLLQRAAKEGSVPRFRRVSERAHLWHNLVELGWKQGAEQHQLYLNTPHDDRQVLIEMGLLLLGETDSISGRRDILEKYPVIVCGEGLSLANGTVEMLTLRDAPDKEIKTHYEAARLIERAISIGIDRALSELK